VWSKVSCRWYHAGGIIACTVRCLLTHTTCPLPTAELPEVYGLDKGKGIVLRARLGHAPEGYVWEMSVSNVSAGVPLDGFMIQVGPGTCSCRVSRRRGGGSGLQAHCQLGWLAS